MVLRRIIYILSLLLAATEGKAQSLFEGYEHLFSQPRTYVALYRQGGFVIDGDIDGPEWKDIPWTDCFVDIEGSIKPLPFHQTKAKIAWDDKMIYFAAELEESNIWATLKKRDAIIYHDNDFEIFINPSGSSHDYFEFEVNALNTMFDLFMAKPYRNGGRALISWDALALRSAVKLKGTLNNGRDKDRGWCVEIAIPFSALTSGTPTHTPKDGDVWRLNFSRVQWDINYRNDAYVKKVDSKGNPLPERNWVWSPQGVVNMHYPERWGYLQFNKASSPEFKMDYKEYQKRILWLIYYKQQHYYQKYKSFAFKLSDLNIPQSLSVEGKTNNLSLLSQTKQFSATISLTDGSSSISINDQGLTELLKP